MPEPGKFEPRWIAALISALMMACSPDLMAQIRVIRVDASPAGAVVWSDREPAGFVGDLIELSEGDNSVTIEPLGVTVSFTLGRYGIRLARTSTELPNCVWTAPRTFRRWIFATRQDASYPGVSVLVVREVGPVVVRTCPPPRRSPGDTVPVFPPPPPPPAPFEPPVLWGAWQRQSVRITSNPPGAFVFVGNRQIGRTAINVSVPYRVSSSGELDVSDSFILVRMPNAFPCRFSSRYLVVENQRSVHCSRRVLRSR
jgi:hypothetical protein